ncbi:hypothetical protein BJV77DRAFT_538099 [Russula vinacea]|nr:hypothetical protein BJV77DRAFT_538099 [Russula vinacea]
MRFITWPTLPNAFIIFTVILPFLISTVNAVNNFTFVSPSPDASGHEGLYFAGQEYEITWTYYMDDTSVTDDFGGVCNLYLVETNTGPNQTWQWEYPLPQKLWEQTLQ